MTAAAQTLVAEIAAMREVHAAFQFFHLREKTIFDWQVAATQIPSPPFGEQPRAEWLRERFLELGLDDARLDDEGNCIALLRGQQNHAPTLLVSAHIDTVFAADTPLELRAEGDRYYLPGMADNGTGIAALLALAAAFKSAKVTPDAGILFCGNVGEEGIGDLRGMRRIFRDRERHNIGAALVLDGSGASPCVAHALGSRRFHITISGPGGHAWTDFANPNPVVALSRAIAALTGTHLPESPRTTVNFASIGGGGSTNAIPESVAAAVDIRSEDAGEIVRQEVALFRAVEDAVAATSRDAAMPLKFAIEKIGERPASVLDSSSFLAQAVRAVDRHLQLETRWRIASTDANIPLSLGIPAVSVGAGGTSGGTHTLGEWFSPAGRDLALRRILLLTLALSRHLAEPR